MAVGTVKWFNPQKGYGFIVPDEASKDVFVHISAVKQSGLEVLDEGQRVEFELIQQGDGRTNAGNISLID